MGGIFFVLTSFVTDDGVNDTLDILGTSVA